MAGERDAAGEVRAAEGPAKARRWIARLGDCALWTLFIGFLVLPILLILRPQLFFGMLLVLFYLSMLPGAFLADLFLD